jgi:hypothetical protein
MRTATPASLKHDRQVVEPNGSPARVGVNHDACRDRGRETEIVRSGVTIDHHAGLLAARPRIDDLTNMCWPA